MIETAWARGKRINSRIVWKRRAGASWQTREPRKHNAMTWLLWLFLFNRPVFTALPVGLHASSLLLFVAPIQDGLDDAEDVQSCIEWE